MRLDDADAERAWVAAAAVLVGVVAVGSALFRDAFYGGFVWHYFWGPVYADANGATCAAWDGGARTLLTSQSACRAAAEPVAYPGYTPVSEVGYMVVLLFALVGVVLLLRRLAFLEERRDVWALLPFVFFGGALRVLEDANDAALDAAAGAFVAYPWNTLIISPLIYVTVFVVTLAAVVGAVWAARRGYVSGYVRPLVAAGSVLLAAALAALLWVALTRPYGAFHPVFTVLTLLVATVTAAATWALATRYWPVVASGTGRLGVLVVWAHAVDGAANVIAISWGRELGLPADLAPKHPANRAVIDLTQAVLPDSVAAVTGTAWPFLVLKLAVATAAVWLFNEAVIEENPRYSLLLLLAIVAVGLGPGTRDMLRATVGV